MLFNNINNKDHTFAIRISKIVRIPNNEINKDLIMETIGNNVFALIYRFNDMRMYIGFDEKISTQKSNEIMKAVPGLELSICDKEIINASRMHIFSAYRKPDSIYKQFLSDIFSIGLNSGFFAVLFLPASEKELEKSKKYLESILSKKTLKQTISVNSGFLNRSATKSSHSDRFEDLDEHMLLTNALESINSATLSNGIKHKIFFISDNGTDIKEYLSSRFLILDKQEIECKGIEDAVASASLLPGLAFGTDYSKNLFNLYGRTGLSYVIPSAFPECSGNVAIGTYMKNGAQKTDNIISIDITSMNLGFILSGLPGSGKTSEAKSIINYVIFDRDFKQVNKTGIVIISPTDEWNEFALSHKMNLIQPFSDRIPINFFRCPEGVDIERFYSDLAMILSSASKSGPYENPMEKCMINAFRQIYKKTRNPEPVDVYNEIERSIIKFHAKSNNIGVQYTKHGENIKSSLENLRNILNRPEYSTRKGIALEELFSEGVVFDLSNVSNSDKAYMYALILNNAYSAITLFNTKGDNDLRFLICLEEAQLIFEKSRLKESAAVKDLKFRIQDFRKRGVGLMLLTHNINNIDPEIRRLCQLKLYLKQSPDIAKIAAEDLVFTFSEDDEIVSKLKHLDSRIGAFNYITKENGKKISNDTIFIETNEYNDADNNKENYDASINAITHHLDKIGIRFAEKSICTLSIIKQDTKPQHTESEKKQNIKAEKKEILFLRISYLGDEIAEQELHSGSNECKQELIIGRKYTFQFLNKNKRAIFSESISARKKITIEIIDSNVSFT